MQDKIFATISLLGVIAFLAVVTFYVSEVDLWIVTIIVISIAIIFISREIKAGGSHFEDESENGSEN